MKTQTEVKLPEPHRMDDGGWEFPGGWTDEDKQDWLNTHPATPILDHEADQSAAEETKQAPALAMVVPPGQEDTITTDNYNPQDFLLVHMDVWQEFLNGLCDGDDAQVALKGLQKLHRAHMRGMKKVNQHWHGTKRDLYRERLLHTRTARKLRKARAGRDRWLRRVTQLETALAAERLVTQGQEIYIRAIEQRMNG